MKENPSRTDETKITPTSYILLGLYSSRNADISVPQFFHFLPWEPHSPKPGAWSGSRVQCSDLTLDWTWAKVQNMKTILLQTITFYFLTLDIISAQVASVPALRFSRLQLTCEAWCSTCPWLFYARMGLGTLVPHLLDVETKVPTLPLHTRSSGQPHSRAAGKHRFVTDLPLLLLSFKPHLWGQLGSCIIC